MRQFKKNLLLGGVYLCTAIASTAVQAFVVSDIRVEGLQRISSGSVFASLPINIGDDIDDETLREAVRILFRSGNFDDIRIGRDGSVLVVIVAERPSISEISIDGNKAIETEALLDGLNNAGLAEGQVFKRSTLEGMKQELTRQYVAQGRYDARVETDVIAQPRNRVAININIDEGNSAAIKHINVVGSTVFEQEDLVDLFELKTTGLWSWFTNDDQYAKEKLKGDLETLESYYLDRGYINFAIDSSQVSITPSKEDVYITVNISEGDLYHVGKVELSGDIILPEAEMLRFVVIKEGEIFSQAKITATEELLTQRLGDEGYNFAKVSGIPETNNKDKIVAVKFFVDPGKRTYVNRIDFRGNTKTSDEVLRREMRQLEGAPASSAKIEQSRVRLERLGFFKEAKVETLPVPGTDDLIDLEYGVEEQPSGSIGASVGYSQDAGILLGANVQQNNWFGTGKQVTIGANKSSYLTSIRFGFTNPYFTEDGVSRGFSVYYTKRDLSEVGVTSYSTDTKGAAMNFGYPISEIERLGFALGWSNTEVEVGPYAVQEIKFSPRTDLPGIEQAWFNSTLLGYNQAGQAVFSGPEQVNYFSSVLPQFASTVPGFLDENGDEFDNYTLTSSWTQSTLNRGQLATQGASQALALEFTVPGSDLFFYKLSYNGQIFFPFTEDLTLRLRTELGFGDGYSNTEGLPFYENYYSGGFGSVRGFESNSLGPRSTPPSLYIFRQAVTAVDANGNPTGLTNFYAYEAFNNMLNYYSPYGSVDDPFGGNVLIEGSAEILFPLPFIKDQRSLRSVVFVDFGNVYSTDCRATQENCFSPALDELRYSAGVGVTWITGFGPMTFSLAKALNDNEFDEVEVFQFSLGRTF